jgi:hypothetical protein
MMRYLDKLLHGLFYVAMAALTTQYILLIYEVMSYD